MSNKNPFQMIVKGAAFTTGASILVPVNIWFLQRQAWPLVIATGCVQFGLLAYGLVTLWLAHREAKK